MKRLACAALLSLAPLGAAAGDDVSARCLDQGDRGDYRLCERAVAAHPEDLRLRRALARALLVGGAEKRAVLEYDRVAQLAPDSAEAQFELAVALGALDHFEDAERPLERALALKPDYADAHRLAVILHQRLQRWERALPHALRLAEAGDPLAMHDVALAYEFGRGAPRDEALALTWLGRAAEAGHVGAADRLTQIYLEGLLGVPPDEAQALAWAAKARQARRGLE